MGKETLGYATRTEAVLALRRQGRTTREIANLIGIRVETVSALECSARRSPRHGGPVHVRPEFGGVSLNTRQLLRPQAAARGMSVDRLIIHLIDQIAESNLVDAVLDDRE